MRRLVGTVLGLLLGWAIGTVILFVVSVVLVGFGVPPADQIVGMALAMLVFVLASGALGFRLSRPRTPASD